MTVFFIRFMVVYLAALPLQVVGETSHDQPPLDYLDGSMKIQMMSVWAFNALGAATRNVRYMLLNLPHAHTFPNNATHAIKADIGVQCHDRLFTVWHNALRGFTNHQGLALPATAPATVAIDNRTFDAFTGGSTLTDNLEYIVYSLRKKGLLARTFLLPYDHFQELSRIAAGGSLTGPDQEQARLQKAMKGLQSYTRQDISKFLHTSSDSVNPNLIAIQQSPFSSRDITEAEKSLGATEKIINKRVANQIFAIHWHTQLLHHALAGAATGAGIQVFMALAHKAYSGNANPWHWTPSDITDISAAIVSGALLGGLTTSAVWGLNYRLGIPLWLGSTLVTSVTYSLQELSRMAFSDNADTSLEGLLKSLPATALMSTGAALGEQLSPIPLAGSLGGVLTARMAIQYVMTLVSSSDDAP